MVYTLFCFKDKQLDKYTAPSLSNLKDYEDLKEDVRTQIVKTDSVKRNVFLEKNLVVLGTFDANTGVIISHDPEFLLNCDEVISEVQDYERRKNSQN